MKRELPRHEQPVPQWSELNLRDKVTVALGCAVVTWAIIAAILWFFVRAVDKFEAYIGTL